MNAKSFSLSVGNFNTIYGSIVDSCTATAPSTAMILYEYERSCIWKFCYLEVLMTLRTKFAKATKLPFAAQINYGRRILSRLLQGTDISVQELRPWMLAHAH